MNVYFVYARAFVLILFSLQSVLAFSQQPGAGNSGKNDQYFENADKWSPEQAVKIEPFAYFFGRYNASYEVMFLDWLNGEGTLNIFGSNYTIVTSFFELFGDPEGAIAIQNGFGFTVTPIFNLNQGYLGDYMGLRLPISLNRFTAAESDETINDLRFELQVGGQYAISDFFVEYSVGLGAMRQQYQNNPEAIVDIIYSLRFRIGYLIN